MLSYNINVLRASVLNIVQNHFKHYCSSYREDKMNKLKHKKERNDINASLNNSWNKKELYIPAMI